jgi:hypothetical protein
MEDLEILEAVDNRRREVLLKYGSNVDLEFILQRATERASIFARTSYNQCSKTGFLTLCALAVGLARNTLIEFYENETGIDPPDFVLEPMQVSEGYSEPLYFWDPLNHAPVDLGVRTELLVEKGYQWGTSGTGLAFNTGGKGNYVVRRDDETGVLLAERIIPNECINYRNLEVGPYMPDFGIPPRQDLGMRVRQLFYASLNNVAPNGMYDIGYIITGLIQYGCPIDLSELTYTESKYERMTLD